MKVKSSDDYIDELSVYFPQIDKKELKRMVDSMTGLLTMYMKDWYRGFSVTTKNTLVEDGKKQRFKIQRIFGRRHLNSMKKGVRKYKERNGRTK